MISEYFIGNMEAIAAYSKLLFRYLRRENEKKKPKALKIQYELRCDLPTASQVSRQHLVSRVPAIWCAGD
jgi:hypothetical protein